MTQELRDSLAGDLSARPLRVVVTGSAGFIGSHLSEHLLRAGHAVIGVDDLSSGSLANVEDVRAQVGPQAAARLSFLRFDVADREAMRACTEGVDLVFHQAAVGSVPRSVADPERTHHANVEGFVSVLEAARASGVRALVYASSSSVYGDHPALPKREADLGRPLSPYAAGKRANELYAQAWANVYGLPVLGLRYFNVVGPRQRSDGPYAAVIPRWIEALLARRSPEIFGDGSASRDFCPVEVVLAANFAAARALLGRAAAATPAVDLGAVFNVALGRQTTLLELLDALRSALAAAGEPRGDVPVRMSPPRPGDIAHSLADISAITHALGVRPEIRLEDALARTVGWFTERWRRRPSAD